MAQLAGIHQSKVNRGAKPPSLGTNSISALAWYFLTIATIVTFLAFMIFDPNPDLLLASCSAFNVAILLKATYTLYEWGLLLSPMSAAVVGPGWIVFYTWGNLGARIAGEGRYGSNYGSLDYFGSAALLSTIGLYVFYIVVFVLFAGYIRNIRIRYEHLHWKLWQGAAVTLFTLGVIVYLSLKYPFAQGYSYFLGVESGIDRWLSASIFYFLTLATIINVSVAVNQDRIMKRLIGYLCLLTLVILVLGLRSRTYMILLIVQAGLSWITLRPHRLRAIIPAGIAVIAAVFLLGTVVKTYSNRGLSNSVWDNLLAIGQADIGVVEAANIASLDVDLQYRTAGLEYPATLLYLLDLGVLPMYGQGAYQGILQGFPDFLRPIGQASERNAIGNHFIPQGLQYGDSIGVPLTSGIADFGLLGGVIIYVAIAIYCLLLWRITQISPRFFVVFLSVGVGAVGDLFWEHASSVLLKEMGFMFLVVFILGPIWMPRWVPPPNVETDDPTDLKQYRAHQDLTIA